MYHYLFASCISRLCVPPTGGKDSRRSLKQSWMLAGIAINSARLLHRCILRSMPPGAGLLDFPGRRRPRTKSDSRKRGQNSVVVVMGPGIMVHSPSVYGCAAVLVDGGPPALPLFVRRGPVSNVTPHLVGPGLLRRASGPKNKSHLFFSAARGEGRQKSVLRVCA